MRNPTSSVLTYTGALIALVIFFTPVPARANATFTRGDAYPFVSSINLNANGRIITVSQKTNQNITVTISVDPGTTTPNNIHYTQLGQSDSHLFTENGTFVFTFDDDYGNTGSSTVTIDNIDRTPPEITIGSYATTTTKADVTVSATTNEGTLDASSFIFIENGAHDFVATDEAGNVSTSTITLTNIDKTLPVITLNGAVTVTVKVNGNYVDDGARVSDNVDAPTNADVSGSVNTGIVGTYTLTYTYTDIAGNVAVPVTRTVEVIRGSSSGGGGGGGSRTVTQATSQPTSGRVLGATTYNFVRDLKLKDTGEDVTALQEVLIAEGFLKEASTGYFGMHTETALRAYQTAHGIRKTGVMGPITRQTLGSSIPATTTSTNASLTAKIATLLAQIQALKALLAKQQQGG